jgi:hypothetical protein
VVDKDVNVCINGPNWRCSTELNLHAHKIKPTAHVLLQQLAVQCVERARFFNKLACVLAFGIRASANHRGHWVGRLYGRYDISALN